MIPEGHIIIPGNDEISFERCSADDFGFIAYVMEGDDIKSWFDEDGDGDVNYRLLLEEPGIYAIKILLYGNPIGLFFVAPLGRVLFNIQVAILPPYRGRYSVEAAKAGMRWLFDNTDCQKLVAFIPKNNRKSYAMTRAVGMRIIGVMEKSFLKNGKLHDQYLLGITKARFFKKLFREERSNG